MANVKGIIVSSPEHGIDAYGLTDKGKHQAREAIKGWPVLDASTRIVASDFLRTRQTAQEVRDLLQCNTAVEHSSLIRERFFGTWELTSDKNYGKVWADDRNMTTRHQVEPVEQVLSRALACIAGLEACHEKKSILLVSHGDTLQILITHFLGWPPTRHREVDPMTVAQIRSLNPAALLTERLPVKS